jgi:hypothetical protein
LCSRDDVDKVNAKLGGNRVTSIEYRISDPAISEISLSDLGENRGRPIAAGALR